MGLIKKESLGRTLNAVNEEMFYGRTIPKAERVAVAKWIAARQGMELSYAEMPAPTRRDIAEGYRVFTGEKMRVGAGGRHMLGQEACRALILLDVADKAVRDALDRATAGMMARITKADGTPKRKEGWGTYCCAPCSVAFWRHLGVGGLAEQELRLAAGMKALRAARDAKGRWGRFPFYYTLLALSDLEPPSAVSEMRYAAPPLERMLRRKPRGDVYDVRRRTLAERVLARC